MAKGNGQKTANGSNLDFEAQLWEAADKMRGHMDASEYKHVCLGLIFLKYISDAFEENASNCYSASPIPRANGSSRTNRNAPKPPRTVTNISPRTSSGCRPKPAGTPSRPKPNRRRSARSLTTRWARLSARIPRSKACCRAITPGPASTLATRASANLVCESHRQDFCEAKDHVRLGGLVDIISNIGFNESAAKSKDVLGRVYEYFLGKFASAEGKGGGEFNTQRSAFAELACST